MPSVCSLVAPLLQERSNQTIASIKELPAPLLLRIHTPSTIAGEPAISGLASASDARRPAISDGTNRDERHDLLKIKTNLLAHDIKSSLVIITLTLKSLKELPIKTENKKSHISLEDLPSLITVLDGAERNIFQSIKQWNV